MVLGSKNNPQEPKNKMIKKARMEKKKAEKSKLKKKIKMKKQKSQNQEEKQEPTTQENQRMITKDLVLEFNADLEQEEQKDEFQSFVDCSKQPKVLLTTCLYPTHISYQFLQEIKLFMPNSFFYPRKKFKMNQICQLAQERNFTHVMSINEHKKTLYSIGYAVLPNGGYFEYRIKNYVPSYDIYNKGNPTGFCPELILKNFNTALGWRVSRSLGSLFENRPEFKGRTVVTFHNQRDFIFFRHHWYIFKAEDNENAEKEEEQKKLQVSLQEIGPRFVLQLQRANNKAFDDFNAEHEFLYKPDKYVKRNLFYL